LIIVDNQLQLHVSNAIDAMACNPQERIEPDDQAMVSRAARLVGDAGRYLTANVSGVCPECGREVLYP
jgi:hypothetical protein